MERKWREHVECVLRKDICMRRSKAVISTQYPRLYIHSIRNSHRTSIRARHATGLMGSHQSMQTMPRCLDANGLAFGAGTQPTLQNALPLSLSLPHQATPITDIDAKQRRRRKMKIEKQAAALVEKKNKNNINKKKNTTRKNTKRNTTTTATTENTQILICRHFSRY